MFEIIKRTILCFIILAQVISASGCAAAWFLAGAGLAAGTVAVVSESNKQTDAEDIEDY